MDAQVSWILLNFCVPLSLLAIDECPVPTDAIGKWLMLNCLSLWDKFGMDQLLEEQLMVIVAVMFSMSGVLSVVPQEGLWLLSGICCGMCILHTNISIN